MSSNRVLKRNEEMIIDRLSPRVRPAGWPCMYQTWARLLFLHWPIPEESIRPHIPGRLQIDTFQGNAWITLAPFTLWRIRPLFFPALPLLSASHELNVRTYVHLEGVPGIWFFSLDAGNPLSVWGARRTFRLPYFHARMRLEQNGEMIRFRSRRTYPAVPVAEFEADWTLGEWLPPALPESLEFFLVERYWLYAEHRGQVYGAPIHHRPWPLRRANLAALKSTMIESHGLPSPAGTPLLQAQAEPLRVEVWPLRRV
jgi:uncharacterized protein YqjF (DUF2071 family)